MDALLTTTQTWAAIAAGLLTAFTCIAEAHGWLNNPDPADDDTDEKD